MPTNQLKVYFIGRNHGIIPFKTRPWKLENQRKGELEGFQEANGIKRVYRPSRADVIFLRNVPEWTTQGDIKRIEKKIARHRNDKVIINDIQHFHKHNSKDITFSLWQESGIKCPEFKLIPSSMSDQEALVLVGQFLGQHPKAILRTNNEECGEGMHFVNRDTGDHELLDLVRTLRVRTQTRIRQGYRDAKLMLVQFIETREPNNRQHLYRALVLGNQILTIRCICGRHDCMHAATMDMADFEHFVAANKTLIPKLHKNLYSEQIIAAMESLNANLGGLDFFLVDDEIIFLELNPMWGRSHTFGHGAFAKKLLTEERTYHDDIPHIYDYLNATNFYQKMYESLHLLDGKPNQRSLKKLQQVTNPGLCTRLSERVWGK